MTAEKSILPSKGGAGYLTSSSRFSFGGISKTLQR
jgi:hypothetical protein